MQLLQLDVIIACHSRHFLLSTWHVFVEISFFVIHVFWGMMKFWIPACRSVRGRKQGNGITYPQAFGLDQPEPKVHDGTAVLGVSGKYRRVLRHEHRAREAQGPLQVGVKVVLPRRGVVLPRLVQEPEHLLHVELPRAQEAAQGVGLPLDGGEGPHDLVVDGVAVLQRGAKLLHGFDLLVGEFPCGMGTTRCVG